MEGLEKHGGSEEGARPLGLASPAPRSQQAAVGCLWELGSGLGSGDV